MTTTNWRKAATGDFAKAGKWDDGRPGIHRDAVIAATGADYVVKVISADAARTLTLDSINATLLEKVHGSLNVGTLDIEAGTAVLTTANTIGSIALAHNGELEFSSSAALGAATLSIAGFAVLAATANAEISNDITLPAGQASFAVANGAILKLDGGLTFNTQVATTLNFMGSGAHGAGDGTGVVDLDGTVGAMSAQKANFLNITGVTLGTSIANNTGFDTFLSNFHIVKIESNSVLDLTGQSNVTLRDVQGAGEILNSGPHENLTLVGGGGGEIRGDFDLTYVSGEAGGTIALKSGDAIHVIDGCDFFSTHFESAALAIDLKDAGTFSGGSISFEGATFDGAGPAVDLGTVSGASLSFVGATFGGAGPAINFGTGQNNRLDIDHTFTGTISNFGGHNGGTDHIGVDDEGAISTLQYNPNEAGTGGDLVVTYANSATVSLHLEGTYTQDDFTVDPGSPGLIDCSAEQPAPHVPAHLVDSLI